MAITSIIGAPGVGKSFLTQQLAALDCLPCFLEGEEGIIPDDVFESCFTGNPVKRFTWFIDRFKKNMARAKKISDSGITCYVDGAAITDTAIMLYEDKKYHSQLKPIVDSAAHLESDITVLVTASEARLKELILARGRQSEPVEKALKRAIKIQNIFLKLIKDEQNCILIDRSNLDFKKEKDLKEINEKIKKIK